MIYIKRQSTSLLLALASLSVVSSSLMSCSESVGMTGIILSDKKISFTATEVNGWTPNSSNSNDERSRAVGSYHPLTVKSDLGKLLYLHPVEQVGTYFYNDKDELVTRAGVPLSEINNQNSISTRGTKVTDIGDEILVSAISKKDNVEAEFFPFEKAKRSGNTWHTSNDKYWATDATLSFYAYAPTNASMLSESGSGLSKDRTVHYVAGTGDDIKSQPDFIVAKSENNQRSVTDAANAVNLHFSHALTAITFSVGNDMVLGTVKSVAIRNVKGKGDYDISTGQWTLSSDLSDYEIPLGTNGNGIDIKTGVAKALTTDPLTLMMIPQKFDANSTTKVEIVFDNGAGDRTLSAELKGTEWKAGYTINYKLSANSITTLNMGDVTFPTSWSSSINATATNKIKSAYANGDKIGLFVVDENNKVRDANIAITYNGTLWTLPNGETYKFSPKYSYFAYYPYQSSLTGLPAVNAKVDVNTTATTFFSSAINTWQTSKLTSDQSTLAKLDACDLQIGKAIFDNTASKINFTSMAHAMGLADITLESKILPHLYKLSTDQSYTWTNGSTKITASNAFSDNRKLYNVAANQYVMIVKPKTSTSFNSTSVGNDAWKAAISVSPIADVIATAKAYLKKTELDKGMYQMELGDIYYSDGALSKSTAIASGKTPIGVVGYVAGSETVNYWVEKNVVTGKGGHALVICLRNIGSSGTASLGQGFIWGPTGDLGSNFTAITTNAVMIGSKTNRLLGSGYTATNNLTANGTSATFPAAYQVKIYNELPAPSAKSTGWFLPTVGQWYAIMLGLGGGNFTEGGLPEGSSYGFFKRDGKYTNITDPINAALKAAVGGTNQYTPLCIVSLDCIWTSSVYNTLLAWFVDGGVEDNFGVGSIRFIPQYFDKDRANSPLYVRPFLAF